MKWIAISHRSIKLYPLGGNAVLLRATRPKPRVTGSERVLRAVVRRRSRGPWGDRSSPDTRSVGPLLPWSVPKLDGLSTVTLPMNQKLLPLSRSRTDREEADDDSASGSKRRYLWPTVGLAAAVFLGRRWMSGDDGSATVSEQPPAGHGSSGGGLSRRMKAMIVGTAVLAHVRLVRRRRSGTSAR